MELVAQKFYGPKLMLVMLAFLSAFTAMTTDIYLPALPEMVSALDATRGEVNLSLSLFFIPFAFGLLFWGPLSEKYGRKKILIIGLVLYIISSTFCALASTIHLLIAARVFQAIGASSAIAVATALVKDIYGDSSQRARVLAIIMSLVIVAPIIAPVIGAQLLKVASWRAVFLGLSLFGVVGLTGSLFITETVNQKSELSVIKSLLRPAVLLKEARITLLLALFSSTAMPIMGFLAAASYIYSEHFAMSPQRFSLFFSFNAMSAAFGPMIYIRISKFLTTHNIVKFGFLGIGMSGVSMLLVADSSVYLFAGIMAIATMFIIGIRAPGANLILEQYDTDTGSLSALINFTGTIVGSLSMMIVSIDGLNQINAIATIMLIVGFTGLILWLVIRRANIIRYTD